MRIFTSSIGAYGFSILLGMLAVGQLKGVTTFAQQKKKVEDKAEVARPQELDRKGQKAEGGEKKIFLGEIEVKGWIEKPLAIYIIPGSDPRVDDIEIDRSFMEEILKPVDKDTFEKERRTTTVVIPW